LAQAGRALGDRSAMSGPAMLAIVILAATLAVPLLLYGMAHGPGSHWLGP